MRSGSIREATGTIRTGQARPRQGFVTAIKRWHRESFRRAEPLQAYIVRQEGFREMNEEAMLRTLKEHHRQIEAGLEVIQRHCRLPVPMSSELAVARSQLSSASLARSAFVTEKVVPCLIKSADVDLRAELSGLLCIFEAKRQISSEHVAMWTVATIEEDWEGYCEAAKLIWAMMDDQIDRERRYLGERLKHGSGATSVPA